MSRRAPYTRSYLVAMAIFAVGVIILVLLEPISDWVSEVFHIMPPAYEVVKPGDDKVFLVLRMMFNLPKSMWIVLGVAMALMFLGAGIGIWSNRRWRKCQATTTEK